MTSLPPPLSARARRSIGLGCLLMLILGAAAAALAPGKAISQYRLDAWTLEEGLPQNAIRAILQTREGFVWLATQGGLARYDGLAFKVYDRSNTPAILNNVFHTLAEDASGVLWAGSEKGLLRIEGEEISILTTAEGLASDRVAVLLADRRGTLWIGTPRGLHRYEEGRLSALGDLAGEEVLRLAEGTDASLWIGTRNGLFQLREGRLVSRTADGVVSALLTRRDGSVWVGTVAGLHRLDGAVVRAPGFPSVRVVALAEDRHGNLWIGTAADGLFRLTPGGELSSAAWEEGPAQSILALAEDRQGNLWVGTSGGGLRRLLDGPFTTYGTAEGLSHDMVYPVFEDRAGIVWIGTFGGGLNRFEGDRFTHYTEADGLSSGRLMSLAEDRAGNLWIGTQDSGLNRLADGRFQTWSTADGLADNSVRAIVEDGAGDLWLGTYRGLNRYREGRFETLGAEEGLVNPNVMALALARDGALWIGTAGGLSRFENGTFTNYTPAEGLSSDTVLSLYEDRAGTLWAGTYGGGLNRLRDGAFTVVTSREGLFDDIVYAILEDDRERLWMSGDKGIFRVDRRELEAFARGEVGRVTSVAYGPEHGMKSREANGGCQPAGWKRRDGTLLFATLAGMTVVDPEKLGTAAAGAATVVLEELRADDRSLALRRGQDGLETVVPAGSRRLVLSFTAPAFVTPERIRFRYRLEGFDDDWIEADGERVAVYTRPPPGEYRFHVVASDADGQWHDDADRVVLGLVILAPPWKTWWAYTLYAFALAMAVAGYLRAQHEKLARERAFSRRLNELDLLKDDLMADLEIKVLERTARVEALMADLQARNTELERFAYTVSHDLKGPLLTIKGFLGFLKQDATRGDVERLEQDVERIESAANMMQRLLEDLLELSRIGRQVNPPEEVSFGELAHEARELLAAQLGERGAEVEITGDLPAVFGDRTRLLEVVQNLLANAVTYMGDQTAPRIEIGMRKEEGEPTFFVRDNGMGIEPQHHDKIFGLFERLDAETEGTGIGLALVRRIVEVHQGRVWVESVGRGHGSAFCFTLPGVASRREDGEP